LIVAVAAPTNAVVTGHRSSQSTAGIERQVSILGGGNNRFEKGSTTSSDGGHGIDDALIPLTVNEIRRLLAHLVLAPIHGPDRRLGWSRWRRRRQYQARRCHYHRREETPPL